MSTAPRLAPAAEALLQQVFRAARADRLAAVTLERLLAALLEQPGVAAFWTAGPGQDERAALRAGLADILQGEVALRQAQRAARGRLPAMLKALARACLPRGLAPLDRWLDDAPRFDREVENVLMRALLRVGPRRPVEATDLLLSILDNSAGLASELLRRHGVSRYALVCHLASLAHPLPDTATDALAPNAQVQLCLRNDDFTPKAFAIDVLRTVFAKSPAEADALVQEVDATGHACCGTFPLPLAQEKLRQVADLAAAQQHPLRAFLQVAGQDAEALMA